MKIESTETIDIEERADFINDSDLLTSTVVEGEVYKGMYKSLVGKGTKLLMGPRGCGKTHLMKYAWLKCKSDEKMPLGIYVSFNKYFRLEPFLERKSNAITLFNKWALTKILLSSYEVALLIEEEEDIDLSSILLGKKDDLVELISRLEQALTPLPHMEDLYQSISVSSVSTAILMLSKWLSRRSIILYLDDAAITLTPDYLYELFDIIRSLKSEKISIKASIYPGTTEFGPNFHATHEAETINLWLSVEDQEYSSILGAIIKKRAPEFLSEINSDIIEIFKYASFGIPRTLLVMLRDYHSTTGSTSQQKFNKVLDNVIEHRLNEYLSLSKKLPKYENLINLGAIVLENAINAIYISNSEPSDLKQITFAIEKSNNSLFDRMIKFLVEVGLLYSLPIVSHGDDRKYERFIPHLGMLIRKRTFSSRSKGFSIKNELDNINKKNNKHPVRKNIDSILGVGNENRLALTLPPCKRCSAIRLTDTQRFCHQCGEQLIDESTYTKCMALELCKLPILTEWQRSRIGAILGRKTIGEFLTIQDPGSELRQIKNIGQKRADKIIQQLLAYVDEFLS